MSPFFAKYATVPPPLIHRISPEGPEDILELFNISYEAELWKQKIYELWTSYAQII